MADADIDLNKTKRRRRDFEETTRFAFEASEQSAIPDMQRVEIDTKIG
jgi:hypothetical protein